MQIIVSAARAAMAVGAMKLVAGCSAGPRGAPGSGACPPPPRTATTAELTLTMASSGHSYCLRTGDLVRVVPFGLPTAWLPTRLSGDALVPVTTPGSRKLVPGGPSNLYQAVRSGTATLTQTHLCAPLHPVSEPGVGSAGTSTCLGRGASFRVVIIVY